MATQELRKKPKRSSRIIAWGLVVIWAGLIFVLSSIPGSGYPSHPEILNVVAHFLLFVILAVFLTRALSFSKLSFVKVGIAAIVITSLYGLSDELHQYLVPYRNCDMFDWGVDTIAGIVGTIATIFYLSARIVSRSRKRDER